MDFTIKCCLIMIIFRNLHSIGFHEILVMPLFDNESGLLTFDIVKLSILKKDSFYGKVYCLVNIQSNGCNLGVGSVEVNIMKEKGKKEKKRLNPALYVIGSLAVAAVMAVAMPLIIESGSDLIVKKTQKPLKPIDDEDWGPEIVKKTRGNF